MDSEWLVTFHHPVDLGSQLERYLNEESASLSRLGDIGFADICPSIWKWRVIKINGYNYRKGKSCGIGIQQLAHIWFPGLLELELFCNDLESIEMLSRMWMPVLAKANLCTCRMIKPRTTFEASETCGKPTGLHSRYSPSVRGH